MTQLIAVDNVRSHATITRMNGFNKGGTKTPKLNTTTRKIVETEYKMQ